MRLLRYWYILLVVAVVIPCLVWAFVWFLRYFLGPDLWFAFGYLYFLLSLGMSSSLLSYGAKALVYGGIGLGLWLWLRQDGRFAAAQEQAQMQPLRILVLGQGDTSLEHQLIKKMEQALPECHLTYFDLTAAAVEGSLPVSQQFVGIDLIIGRWPLTLAGKEAMPLTDEVTALLVSSSAPRIIIPHQVSGSDWAGLMNDSDNMVIESVVDKVKKLSLRQAAYE
ncbi:MAG: hypothetical protein IPL78_09770 [Chloroflexi bacterium]|nr:hypothetical protein [Chloroflexota bacterium]